MASVAEYEDIPTLHAELGIQRVREDVVTYNAMSFLLATLAMVSVFRPDVFAESFPALWSSYAMRDHSNLGGFKLRKCRRRIFRGLHTDLHPLSVRNVAVNCSRRVYADE